MASIWATMSMLSSIGSAVVFDQDWNDALADESDHRLGIVVEHDRFLQMQALERRGHAHAKTERAMLEQIKSHATLAFRRSAALRSLAFVFAGTHSSARPRQQFSVR